MTSNNNYDERKRELRYIEEEKEELERMKKQTKDQEEEMERQTFHSMQQLNESIDQWQNDPALQKIFYDQQEILATMQSNRTQFNEDFDKYMRVYNKKLMEREEDCRQDLQKIEQEIKKGEEKKHGNDYKSE